MTQRSLLMAMCGNTSSVGMGSGMKCNSTSPSFFITGSGTPCGSAVGGTNAEICLMRLAKPFHDSASAARSFSSATYAMRGIFPSARKGGMSGSFGTLPLRSRMNEDSSPSALPSKRVDFQSCSTIGLAMPSAATAFLRSSSGIMVRPYFSYQPQRVIAPSSTKSTTALLCGPLARLSKNRNDAGEARLAKPSGFEES